MKIWELEPNKVYTGSGREFKTDEDGHPSLKSRGNGNYVFFNPDYVTAKNITFTEITKVDCDHRDEEGILTLEYDPTYERKGSSIHCTKCGRYGNKGEFQQ